MAEGFADSAGVLWFAGIVVALLMLFALGSRLPVPLSGVQRWLARTAIIAAAIAVCILANMALYRHDAQLDVTREQAFTPSGDAQDIVRQLAQPVNLTFFYQKQDPAGRNAAAMIGFLGRLNPKLTVEAIDIDQHPALANRMGVQVYNAVVLRSGDRWVEAVTTDEREIALAILRVTRARDTVICFATGHGEYDIDNFEFHTHFEGAQSHSHNLDGMAVVQMEQHGLGRLRRAIEKLGLAARKLPLAAGMPAPEDCAALVDANPRTRYTPPEAAMLRAYLERGGSLMLLVEPDYPIDDSLAAVLAEAGARIGDGVIVDPAEHYFTDEQMLAVAKYAHHPVTRGLALSIYPGARPVFALSGDRVTATALFATSAQSYVVTDRLRAHEEEAEATRAPMPVVVAAEGRLRPEERGARFRLLVFGDADFASNSFFPYLSNADMVLGGIAWLIGEERAPSLKPPVEVLPRIALTGGEMRWIFITTVLVLPGSVALAGGLVWWRRRA